MRVFDRKVLLFVLLQIVAVFQVLGQEIFKNYTFQDGISHKTISCITQDSKGYIWIGTTFGLNRFDGYSFKKFQTNDRDSLAISGATIKDIVVDRNDFVWVSNEKGLCYFNPRCESFHKVMLFGKQVIETKRLCVDDDASVWALAKENYLVQIDIEKKTVVKYLNIDSLLGSKSINNYFQVKCIDGFLWVNGTNGVFRLDYKSLKIRKVFPDGTNLSFIQYFKKGKKDEILFVAGEVGIYVLNTKTLNYKIIPKNRFDNENFKILFLSDVEYSQNGTMFVGGFPGLFAVSKDDKITRYNHLSKITFDFDKIITNCLFKDKDNNIWVGTMDDGVFVLNNTPNPFKHYTLSVNKFVGIHAKKICVLDDKIYASNLYGAFCFDRRTMEQTTIANVPIFSIFPLSKKELLLFASNMVYKYNVDSKKKTDVFPISTLQSCFVDSRGIVWITYWGGGMDGYDYKQNKKYSIHVDTANVNKDIIYTLIEDRDGSFWLATFGSGLVHVTNPTASKPQMKIYSADGKKNSISHNILLSLHDDEKGNIWIGTNGGGLNCFNKASERFTVYNTTDGLKSNVIEAVQSDLDGNIWFASSVLSKYDIRKRVFTNFDASDGIVSKYFTNSSYRGADGTLYFGDDAGVLSFNPKNINKKTNPIPPVLTDVRLFGVPINPREKYGDEVPFPLSVGYAEEIVLPYHLSSFSIDFATIDFLNNKNIVYSYRMKGLEDTWIQADANSRHANYSALQPGKYTFCVRASAETGRWSSEKNIIVEITPPWWKTLAFRIFSAIGLLVCFVVVFLYRTRSLKQRNMKLERLVSSRTSELRQANESLKESTQQLDLKNKSLEENQMVIEMKNKDLLDALQAKDKLINILGHDFKNPLSGIQGVAGMLSKESAKSGSEKMKKLADTILVSSTSLMNQMLMVLDWAQSQMNKIQYTPSEIDMGVLLDDSISLMRENARLKNISITTQFEYTTNALIDPRMISTVFRNLLGNAIKFTPRGGKILALIQEYENGINVTFIDTGIGISKENQEAFANRFIDSSYGTENEKGSGLGLQICKSFVEKNHGTITLSSTEGEGSVFTISLPKGKGDVKTRLVTNGFLDEIENIETATILIIEDEESIVEYLRVAFASTYTVIVAKDGKEGLYIAQNMMPDLIISDIGLPGINGLDLCESLKNNELTSHIPVLLTTSTTGNEIQNKGYLSGADDFILKPINIFVLKQKVRGLLEVHEQLKEKVRQNIILSDDGLLPEDSDSKIVRRTIEYINANISDLALDTNCIADSIGMSRTQLWRIFKNATGKSVGDAIRDIRLQKAMEMLKTGKYRVNEVAYDVGYSDPRYFARCFVKVYGKSPSSFADGDE